MNRFFHVKGQSRNIEDIRADLLVLNKADLASALNRTDWQIIRAMDPTSNKPLTNEVLQDRERLRQRYDKVEAEILAATSYDDLLVIYQKYL